METPLTNWQQALVRNTMKKYRQSIERDYIQGKRLIEMAPGEWAFSLLSPPLGSQAAKRRIRSIARNATSSGMALPEQVSNSPDVEPYWLSRTPHFLTIAITYQCQCDCAHCSAHDYRIRTEREHAALSCEELSDAVLQAIELGTTGISLVGGEPLLYPHLYELIESIDKTRCVVSMFSNGEFLTTKTAERLKEAGLFGVFVSLDSPDAATHDANRNRPGLFKKAVDGLRRARDAELLTGIATYVTGEKLRAGDVEALVELGKQLGVLEVFIFDAVPTGRLQSSCDCVLTDEEVEKVNALRQACGEDPEAPRIVHQTMFTTMAYPCVAEGCPAAVVQFHIRANGDVSPCDFTSCSFGNVREKPLAEIWKAMSDHELYARPSRRCRLADASFRAKICGIGRKPSRSQDGARP